MSALPPKADICGCVPNVCQVPSRDISRPLRVSTRQSSFALASLREASRVPVFLAQLLYLLNRGTFMNIIEKSRETVEQLLARRNLPKTYEEKRQYALDLVDMHLHEENPDRIDECIKLYTEDAVWETPARNVTYRGRETIKKMYLRVFSSAEGMTFQPIERFATPDRVFDDMWATFRISGDGFENCPFPIGTKVKMRLLHNFHIRDGMIAKEIGYEIWRRDE